MRNRFKRLSSLTLIPSPGCIAISGVSPPWTRDRDIDRAMRPGVEPVVNSTVKILGNGWHPRQQAKPLIPGYYCVVVNMHAKVRDAIKGVPKIVTWDREPVQ